MAKRKKHSKHVNQMYLGAACALAGVVITNVILKATHK